MEIFEKFADFRKNSYHYKLYKLKGTPDISAIATPYLIHTMELVLREYPEVNEVMVSELLFKYGEHDVVQIVAPLKTPTEQFICWGSCGKCITGTAIVDEYNRLPRYMSKVPGEAWRSKMRGTQ